VGGPRPQPARDALAAVATADGLVVTSVALDDLPDAPRLASAVPDGRVTILQHGADDVPHLDRTWQQRWWGTVVDGTLRLEGHEGWPSGAPAKGVWRRWRDEVAFERACRAGLEAAEATGLAPGGQGGGRASI
jgi:hypothetical protein